MAEWITVAEAAKRLGVKGERIRNAKDKSGNCPEWLRPKPNSNRYEVDYGHEGLFIHIGNTMGKSNAAKKGAAKTTKAKKPDAAPKITSKRMQALERASMEATLRKPIVEIRGKEYDIEKKKLALEKDCGDQISRSLAGFMYTGYMARMNRQMLQAEAKFFGPFEDEVNRVIMDVKAGLEVDPREVARKMTKIVRDRNEEDIRNIKKLQLETLDDWAKENGVQL